MAHSTDVVFNPNPTKKKFGPYLHSSNKLSVVIEDSGQNLRSMQHTMQHILNKSYNQINTLHSVK